MKNVDILGQKLLKELRLNGISRRDFLKYCATTAAVLGLSEFEFTTKVAHAIETSSKKPPVIWLEGQDCAGCTISFTGILNPPASSIILDKISLRYHETAMVASGQMAEEVYKDTVKKGGYVLIVEGSVPSADDRFCMIGDRPFKKILEEAAKNAAAIIAVGACATYGGIPAATPSKGIGLNKALPGKTVINLPTCPVHPDHLAGTLLYFLTTGKVPELDAKGRPAMYFGNKRLLHDNCRRRAQFDAGKFLNDWNDPNQKDWCMFEKGCKGPVTFADCAIRRWNNGINFCIDCGGVCQACSEPIFYEQVTPLYTAESETSKKIWAMRESGLTQKKENT
jgi:hydrogenase small subunit